MPATAPLLPLALAPITAAALRAAGAFGLRVTITMLPASSVIPPAPAKISSSVVGRIT